MTMVERIVDGAYKPYTAEEYIKDFGILPDVSMSNRKDLKAVVSWVVTMPEKVTGAEQKRFFEETYAFLRSRYCDEIHKQIHYLHHLVKRRYQVFHTVNCGNAVIICDIFAVIF